MRQRRQGSMNRRQWEILCSAAKDLPGFHAFGALSGGQLAGALIVCRIDDMFTVPYSMSHCRFLRDHVNNALFFSASCQLLKTENVRGIFFCVESLDAPRNVDEFKMRMGFQSKSVRQRVEFHPFLKPVAVPALHSCTKMLHKHFPSVTPIAKLDGMLRFYLDGRISEHEPSAAGYPTLSNTQSM